jgi:hypothetical protein
MGISQWQTLWPSVVDIQPHGISAPNRIAGQTWSSDIFLQTGHGSLGSPMCSNNSPLASMWPIRQNGINHTSAQCCPIQMTPNGLPLSHAADDPTESSATSGPSDSAVPSPIALSTVSKSCGNCFPCPAPQDVCDRRQRVESTNWGSSRVPPAPPGQLQKGTVWMSWPRSGHSNLKISMRPGSEIIRRE